MDSTQKYPDSASVAFGVEDRDDHAMDNFGQLITGMPNSHAKCACLVVTMVGDGKQVTSHHNASTAKYKGHGLTASNKKILALYPYVPATPAVPASIKAGAGACLATGQLGAIIAAPYVLVITGHGALHYLFGNRPDEEAIACADLATNIVTPLGAPISIVLDCCYSGCEDLDWSTYADYYAKQVYGCGAYPRFPDQDVAQDANKNACPARLLSLYVPCPVYGMNGRAAEGYIGGADKKLTYLEAAVGFQAGGVQHTPIGGVVAVDPKLISGHKELSGAPTAPYEVLTSKPFPSGPGLHLPKL